MSKPTTAAAERKSQASGHCSVINQILLFQCKLGRFCALNSWSTPAEC